MRASSSAFSFSTGSFESRVPEDRDALHFESLDVYFEAEIDLRRRHPPAHAPVLGCALPEQHLDVVRGNAELAEVIHDRPVERLLRIERTAGEEIDVRSHSGVLMPSISAA